MLVFYSLIVKCYFIIWIYGILFIHTSLEGHLDCFHFWLLWMFYEHLFISICVDMFSILFGKYLGVDLWDKKLQIFELWQSNMALLLDLGFYRRH